MSIRPKTNLRSRAVIPDACADGQHTYSCGHTNGAVLGPAPKRKGVTIEIDIRTDAEFLADERERHRRGIEVDADRAVLSRLGRFLRIIDTRTKPDRWKDSQEVVNLVVAAEDALVLIDRLPFENDRARRLRAALKAMD